MNLELLEIAAITVDLVGVLVMVIRFGIAVARFIPTLWKHTGAAAIKEIQEIRCGLGTYLVFALELMIVSDLLHSIMSHEIEDLYFLGALVVLRTIISYFLNKEIQELAGAHS